METLRYAFLILRSLIASSYFDLPKHYTWHVSQHAFFRRPGPTPGPSSRLRNAFGVRPVTFRLCREGAVSYMHLRVGSGCGVIDVWWVTRPYGRIACAQIGLDLGGLLSEVGLGRGRGRADRCRPGL